MTRISFRLSFEALVRKVIPVEQGLRLQQMNRKKVTLSVRKVIPVEQGLRLHSRTHRRKRYHNCVRKVIPVEQGLRH